MLCSDLGLMVALGSLYRESSAALNEIEPSIREKRSVALGLYGNGKNGASEKDLWKTKEFQELNEVAGKAVVKYLDSIQAKLSVIIYLINFAFLVFIILGLCYRQALGNFLWMPFSLIGRVFIKGAKKAKHIHDKI